MDDIHERYPGNQDGEQKVERMKQVVSNKHIVNNKNGITETIKNALRIDKDDFMERVLIPKAYEVIRDSFDEAFLGRITRPKSYYYDDDDFNDYGRMYDSRFTYGSRFDEYEEERAYRERKNRSRGRNYDEPPRRRPDPCEIIIRGRDAKEEAYTVVDKMRKRCRVQGLVTVGDLYDLIGVTPVSTNYNWGWYNEEDINYKRVTKGYLIVVPEPEPIYNN